MTGSEQRHYCIAYNLNVRYKVFSQTSTQANNLINKNTEKKINLQNGEKKNDKIGTGDGGTVFCLKEKTEQKS